MTESPLHRLTTETPEMTPAEFLTARLDELEAKARAATAGTWRVAQGCSGSNWIEADEYTEVLAPAPVDCGAYCQGGVSRIDLSDADVDHIVANHPPSVLADIAAKRRIVEEWERRQALAAASGDYWGDEYTEGLGRAVACLASAFDSHPDWREEWRP